MDEDAARQKMIAERAARVLAASEKTMKETDEHNAGVQLAK